MGTGRRASERVEETALDNRAGKRRYVLAARLSRQVEVRIEDLFLSLPGATKPILGYHITILGPFFLPDEVERNSLTGVSDACRRFHTFGIRIAGVGAFRAPDKNTAYLGVAEPEPLRSLYSALYAATEGQVAYQYDYSGRDPSHFVPHVTLALDLADRELEMFLGGANDMLFDEAVDISEIWLAEQKPNSPWQYVTDYVLGDVPRPSQAAEEPS